MEFIKRDGGKDKMRGCAEHLIDFRQRVLINSIIQEHECKSLFYHMTLKLHLIHVFCIKTFLWMSAHNITR